MSKVQIVNSKEHSITVEKRVTEYCAKNSFCLYCSKQVELIWVHSHYQCPNCKNVVISCCGDS